MTTKAIFFDIDGTLFSRKNFTVPQSVHRAFERLRKDGVKLFIATGRPLLDIRDLEGLQFDGLVTTNGAHCLDGERNTIHVEAIPRQDFKALVRYLENPEPPECILLMKDGSAVNYHGPEILSMYTVSSVALPPVKNFNGIDPDSVLQINIFVTPEQEADLMKNALLGCQSSRGLPKMADINKRGVNKQSGIDRILELNGIDLKDTMAFGDGGNDISMLRHVAVGVAMGDAPDKVKQAAKHVTDAADDNGIYNALEKLVWNAK